MSKTDNPTLSERLRRLMDYGACREATVGFHDLIPEILQALDDNERLIIPAARIYDCNVEAVHSQVNIETQIAAYRATIVQLEKERKEAVDRVAELAESAATLLRVHEIPLHSVNPEHQCEFAACRIRYAIRAALQPNGELT